MPLHRIPGKLKEFIQDLYTGKLHREFHFGPDPTHDHGGHDGGNHVSFNDFFLENIAL